MDAARTGALIAQVRKEKGLTQKELAGRVFVSVQAVSKWEKGKNFPDLALMESLASELGLTVSELLAGERGEAPHEELVRDTLHIGADQLKGQVRLWQRHFLAAVLILLALAGWQVYRDVRDHADVLPLQEAVVQPLDHSPEMMRFPLNAHGLEPKEYQAFYRVSVPEELEECSFRWELWTSNGLEQSREAEREQDWPFSGRLYDRHQVLSVNLFPRLRSTLDQVQAGTAQPGDLSYRFSFLGSTWAGTLESVPGLYDFFGYDPLAARAAVDPREGVILMTLMLKGDHGGGLRSPGNTTGQMPSLQEGRYYLFLRLYCK